MAYLERTSRTRTPLVRQGSSPLRHSRPCTLSSLCLNFHPRQHKVRLMGAVIFVCRQLEHEVNAFFFGTLATLIVHELPQVECRRYVCFLCISLACRPID